MGVFAENTKGAKIFVFVQTAAFGETIFVELVVDLARGTKDGNKDSRYAEDDQNKKSPPFENDGNRTENYADYKKAYKPKGVVVANDVFFGLPRDVFNCLCHNSIIA